MEQLQQGFRESTLKAGSDKLQKWAKSWFSAKFASAPNKETP